MSLRSTSIAALGAALIGLGTAPAVHAKHWCHPAKGYGYGGPGAMYPHTQAMGYGGPRHAYPHGYHSGYKHPMKGHGYSHKGKGHSGVGDDMAGAQSAPDQLDIIETAAGNESFGTLVEAIQAAGLAQALKGEGPFTVFAPSDDAFAKLPEGYVDSLLADKEKLDEVLKYHVVSGRLSAADLLERGEVETLQGGTVSIGQLAVAETDVEAANGVIHIIDEVLVPDTQ